MSNANPNANANANANANPNAGIAAVLPLLGVVAGAVLLSGCASAKFIETGGAYPARSDDCAIQVFSSKTPDREYEEIGILEGEGSLGADTLEKILPKMKREACRAGGDAIILMSSQKTSEIFSDGNDDQMNVMATVIRWE